jgi:hypothetical protein
VLLLARPYSTCFLLNCQGFFQTLSDNLFGDKNPMFSWHCLCNYSCCGQHRPFSMQVLQGDPKDVFHFVIGLSFGLNPFRLTESNFTRFPMVVKGFLPLIFSLMQALPIRFSSICFREIGCFSNAAGWIIPLYTTLSRDSKADSRPI